MTKTDRAEAGQELARIRGLPGYHFARVLLERRMPFRAAPNKDQRVSCSHLAAVIETRYGACLTVTTLAVALHDLGVDVRARRGRGGDIEADVCDSLTVRLIEQDSASRTQRFAWVHE